MQLCNRAGNKIKHQEQHNLLLSPRYFANTYFHFDSYGPEMQGLCCLPPHSLGLVPLPLLCMAPLAALSVLALTAPLQSSAGLRADTTPPAMSGADRGVKAVFHLPLTRSLRTLR